MLKEIVNDINEININNSFFENITKSELEDIKHWFGAYECYKTFDSPISLLWEKSDNEISESLIKTYSIYDAKKHLCKYFNLPEKAFKIIDDDYKTYCYVTFPDKENSLNDILKAMDWYGYFCVTKNPKPLENGWFVLKFEAKFEKNANDLLKTEKFLYHITPKVYKDKILKNGFVPYNRNNKYTYPSRIYFMLGSNDPQDTLNLIKQLSNIKYNKIDMSLYCCFRIDVKKIPENVVFHLDVNKSGAIWTSDNISPNCIIGCIDCK